jgi:hypothetical protein
MWRKVCRGKVGTLLDRIMAGIMERETHSWEQRGMCSHESQSALMLTVGVSRIYYTRQGDTR